LGIVVDRATRSSFTGFAKSPEEIYSSTMNHNELPYTVEQVESGFWGIPNQAFNLLEEGYARVDVGATKVYVEGNFTLVLPANPSGETVDPAKDFGVLLTHLTKNPALGRRFGLIVYGDDFRVLPPVREADLWEWDKTVTFFRAVEEFARPKLSNNWKYSPTTSSFESLNNLTLLNPYFAFPHRSQHIINY